MQAHVPVGHVRVPRRELGGGQLQRNGVEVEADNGLSPLRTFAGPRARRSPAPRSRARRFISVSDAASSVPDPHAKSTTLVRSPMSCGSVQSASGTAASIASLASSDAATGRVKYAPSDAWLPMTLLNNSPA